MKKMKEKSFIYLITMLMFQIIIIFVLPFLPNTSADAKLEFISLTTCGFFGATILMLIANWKEVKKS